MLTLRRLIEIKHGRDVLKHRIGENDSWSVDQLPNPAVFTRCGPRERDQVDLGRLGTSLAESLFKLYRPEPDHRPDVDIGAAELAAYLSRAPDEVRRGVLNRFEMLAQLSLNYPGRLPEFVKRLDALDNDTLQENATKALCWESVGEDSTGFPMYFGDDGGIFAGLMDSEPFDDETAGDTQRAGDV